MVTQSTASSHELRTRGYCTVDYPDPLQKAVERAVTSWQEFCALPLEEKNAFAFLEDSHGDGAGYEWKAERVSKKDLKENFHVTFFQYPRLAEIASKRTFPFLKDAKLLLDGMEPLIMKFAQDVEEECGVAGVVEQTRASKPYWILRYLHYFGDQTVGSEIAAAHADKGAFTLHLFESDDGLQHYCVQERVWKPMPVSERQTVIIPAMQLQLQSKGDLKALYHRVVATDRTARTGRFSMVCFIPFQDVPMYNKRGYGSMQVHDVGFNYDMPHQEFAALFH